MLLVFQWGTNALSKKYNKTIAPLGKLSTGMALFFLKKKLLHMPVYFSAYSLAQDVTQGVYCFDLQFL